MTHEQLALWHRIREFQIDAPDASFPFSKRLARENGWTPAYTERVIDEYRKFAFLFVAAGHGVTPSKAVDEAWHLHLLYTRNYWEEFCPQALGKSLHHNPANGNMEDDEKYEGWYEKTLSSYERFFGAPPMDVWGGGGEKTPKRSRKWWPAFGLATLLLAGCTEQANPLDWHGPDFLKLFFGLYLVAVLGGVAIRWLLSGPEEGPPAREWQLHLYEKAFLNGGHALALATALTRLTTLGVLEVDRKTGRMRTAGSHPDADHPLDRAIIRAAEASGGVKYDGVSRRAAPILGEMEHSLRRQGLWMSYEKVGAATVLPFVVASLPLVLGVMKIMVGLDRGRPVEILVFGCIAGLIVNLAFFSVPKRSRYGSRVLQEYQSAQPRRVSEPSGVSGELALFGIGVLAAGEYAYLRPAVMPQSVSSGDGGGSSCGGSSGCGGGGCGGGGCGGCGGS